MDVSITERKKRDPIYLSLILPTYNERENIKILIESLIRSLKSILYEAFEIIVVDDNSSDRTWEAAQALGCIYPQVRVIRRIHERGLATAVIAGWQAARGPILGVMDSDLQHPPEILLKLIELINNGADLAVASRHVEGGGTGEWHMIRRMVSRAAQILGLIILPKVVGRVHDPMSGYFLVRRTAIAGKPLDPLGYKILIEVLARGDVKQIKEWGYVFQERQVGRSKMNARLFLDYLRHLYRLRFFYHKLSQKRIVQIDAI